MAKPSKGQKARDAIDDMLEEHKRRETQAKRQKSPVKRPRRTPSDLGSGVLGNKERPKPREEKGAWEFSGGETSVEPEIVEAVDEDGLEPEIK